MDIATLIGIIVGAVMVVFGILWGNGVSVLQNFVDVPSIIITIGGSLSGLIASYTLKDFLGSFKGIGLAFKDPKYDHGATISKIIELSNVARKEGLLALEEVAQNLDDEFMKKGILLIVDGTEPELVPNKISRCKHNMFSTLISSKFIFSIHTLNVFLS